MTVSTKTIVCGFCDTEEHSLCPWGIRNGNGNIVQCVCRECHRPEHRRCTECGNRRAEEIGDTWQCLDRDSCAAEQQRRIDANPFVQQMAKVRATREALEALPGVRTTPSAPRSSDTPPRPARPTSRGPRDCLCGCGGQTKGGKFLPGHDSKYLNHLVATTDLATINCSEHDARERAYAISDAFGAKYDKRTGK